jgi:hypothetical protein
MHALKLGSLMYAIGTIRPNTCFAAGIVSKNKSNLEPLHWVVVKHILKYLRRTIDYMFVYHGEDLIAIGYADSNFSLSRIVILEYPHWGRVCLYRGWWSH